MYFYLAVLPTNGFTKTPYRQWVFCALCCLCAGGENNNSVGKEEQNSQVPSPVVWIVEMLLKKAVLASDDCVKFWELSNCTMTVCLLNVRLKRSSSSLILKDRHTLIFWIVARKHQCICFKYNPSWRHVPSVYLVIVKQGTGRNKVTWLTPPKVPKKQIIKYTT